MFKFNYNLFKSNCNSLSKQFNQVHSTCVVYHDICQQSISRPTSSSVEIDTCNGTPKKHENFCINQTCSSEFSVGENQINHCSTSSTNTLDHHHHHNHEHGLIYSKRVRSILLLNALLSSPSRIKNVSNENLESNYSSFMNTWNACTEQIRNYTKKSATKEKKIKNEKIPKVVLSEQEISGVIDFDNFKNEIDNVYEKLKEDFFNNINLKIGSNIGSLKVETTFGTFLLKEVCQISKKNNNFLLNISASPDMAPFILETIRNSGMNVNPQQDVNTIYFPINKSTKEHREILIKNCKSFLNKAKKDLHSIQNSYIKKANLKKFDKNLSQDFVFNCCENIKYLIDQAFSKCSCLCDEKIKQLGE